MLPGLLVSRGCSKRFLAVAISTPRMGKSDYDIHWLICIYGSPFILLQLNHFVFRVELVGWWFEHSMSWSCVFLSAEGARNVSWPLIYLLRAWGSLTMTFTGKFVYGLPFYLITAQSLWP